MASCTVQPEGIPLIPEGQEDIDGFLTNVPVEATLFTQNLVEYADDISDCPVIYVARHLI